VTGPFLRQFRKGGIELVDGTLNVTYWPVIRGMEVNDVLAGIMLLHRLGQICKSVDAVFCHQPGLVQVNRIKELVQHIGREPVVTISQCRGKLYLGYWDISLLKAKN
jgi:hypothetical protein